MREGTEVFARARTARAVVGRRRAGPAPGDRDGAGGYAGGWTFTAPVVEMPVYLDWLAGRLDELGGTITRLNLHGACRRRRCRRGGRLLRASAPGSSAGDPSVVPVRGQVVLVEQVGLERWWLDTAATAPTYVVPRSRRHRRRRHRRGGGVEPDAVAGGRRRDPAAGVRAGARAARRRGAAAQGRAAAGPPGRAAGAGGRRRALLRARRGRGDPSWGCADEVVGLVGSV